ncbi:MAG: ABC transporter permease subunit [Bifidobacteriaceae bacterium]|jgi:ABC-type amino acid transport system permease subunit|nr:ABC transporter permease subunit [Bifidobacteriaceae bacterium]
MQDTLEVFRRSAISLCQKKGIRKSLMLLCVLAIFSATIYSSSSLHADNNDFMNALYSTLIEQDRYKILLKGFIITFQIAFCSFFLMNILAVLLTFLATRQSKVIKNIVSVYTNALSTIPELTFLFIVFYGFFGDSNISPIIITSIAFAILFSPELMLLFVSSIDSVSYGQIEAARALGFSKIHAFRTIVLPQAIRSGLHGYMRTLVYAIKVTALTSSVAVADLAYASQEIQEQTSDTFFPSFIATMFYVALIVIVIITFTRIKNLIDYKRRRG